MIEAEAAKLKTTPSILLTGILTSTRSQKKAEFVFRNLLQIRHPKPNGDPAKDHARYACWILDEFESWMEESEESSIIKPKLSTHEEIKEELLKHKQKHGLYSYWEEEKNFGRLEKAQLVKIGFDVSNIWEINDADQSISATIYFSFS